MKMFAYKTVFIKITIIWYFLSCVSYAATTMTPSDLTAPDSGMCECAAIFKNGTEDNTTLIFSKTPINTTCDQAGKNICLTMCTSLAEIGKEYIPGLICRHLTDADTIKPMMFTRVCEEDYWVYGKITAEAPMCCKEGALVLCKA